MDNQIDIDKEIQFANFSSVCNNVFNEGITFIELIKWVQISWNAFTLNKKENKNEEN